MRTTAGTRMSVSILFTGYAPVHFACFEPIYWRLTRSPEVTIRLSGGLRSRIRPASGSTTRRGCTRRSRCRRARS